MEDGKNKRDDRVRDNDLIDHGSRGMPLSAAKQPVYYDKTFELCPKFEQTLLISRDGPLWGYHACPNPQNNLSNDRILMLSLVEANTMAHQNTTKGRYIMGRIRKRR